MNKNAYAIVVLNHEVEKLTKKLATVIEKCESSPASELLELMEEARIKLSGGASTIDPELTEWFSQAAKKEKRLKREMAPGAAEKVWDSRLKIEMQISDLNSAIFRLNY